MWRIRDVGVYLGVFGSWESADRHIICSKGKRSWGLKVAGSSGLFLEGGGGRGGEGEVS